MRISKLDSFTRFRHERMTCLHDGARTKLEKSKLILRAAPSSIIVHVTGNLSRGFVEKHAAASQLCATT